MDAGHWQWSQLPAQTVQSPHGDGRTWTGPPHCSCPQRSARAFRLWHFEAFCERHHTDLVVIDGETLSPEQELVQDLVAILTVFSARLHGLGSYKKVIKDAALQKNQAERH